jgi:uncharacterized protein YraI
MKKLLCVTLAAWLLSACSASIAAPQPETPSPLPFYTATLAATFTPPPSSTPAPPTITPTVAPVEGTVTTQVNVRAGPEASQPSLGLLNFSSKVQVVGKDPGGQWLQILYPAAPGGVGWVTAAYIEVKDGLDRVPVVAWSAPAAAVTTPQASATASGRSAVTTQQVNVRAGPAQTFDSLGMLEAGSTVTLTGRNPTSNWIQIDYPAGPNGRGWVAALYLKGAQVDTLPYFDNQGNPLGVAANTPLPGGLPTAAATPLSAAREDLDSAENPAVRLSFAPSGPRLVSYASDLSSPTGDAADWVEFTVTTAQAGQGVYLYFELDCAGNGAITLEMRQGGAPVQEFPGLLCGQYDLAFKVLGGQPYQLILRADGSAGDLRYVAYTLYLSVR